MKKVNNYADPSIDGASITIAVEGVSVSGKIIFRDKRNIAVEITDPYSGISEQSGCIPLLALQYHNFLGKDGDEKAASLLSALYRFCVFADAHKDRLLTALQDYNFKLGYAKHFSPEARENEQRKLAALQELQALRKEFKAGNIDNIEYQRRLKPLNKTMKALAEESEIDLYDIFEESFKSFRDTPIQDLRYETVLTYLEHLGKA